MDFANGDFSFFSALGDTNVTVLVVDSDRASRLRIAALLNAKGHTVHQAADGGDIPFRLRAMVPTCGAHGCCSARRKRSPGPHPHEGRSENQQHPGNPHVRLRRP